MNYPVDQLNVKSSLETKSHQLSPGGPHASALSLKDIVADVVRLKQILREETTHMRDLNIAPVKEVHEEKMQLIKKLELQKKLLKQNPDLLAEKTPEEVENFKLITSDMEELLMSNYLEALKAKEVNERVLSLVAKAVAKHGEDSSVYSKGGYRQNSILAKTEYDVSNSQSVVVNQTI